MSGSGDAGDRHRKPDDDRELRRQLLGLLRGEAHLGFEEAVRDFPTDAINLRPPNVPYTPWAILEHTRITQWDILEYIRYPEHVSPEWPDGYWPDPDRQVTREEYEETLRGFRSDLHAIEELVRDPAIDLLAPLGHTPGHSILREVRLIGDHNAYHIGEFAILRQVMGTWPKRVSATG